MRNIKWQSAHSAIVLNLDETSVGLWFQQPVGCVAAKQRWRGGIAPTASVPPSRKRGAVTFCAMITHETTLQPLLPQLVLGNKRILTHALRASFEGEISPSLHVWAEKSGWMTSGMLVKYLHLVADVMDGYPEWQGIVVLDCAPAHVSVEAVEVANTRSLYLCFVPAGCTGHLQPLDLGCFSPCKAFLRRHARKVLSRTGEFTKLDWMLGINKTATELLNGRHWRRVFERCGILGERSNLKGFLGDMAVKYTEVEPALVAPTPKIIDALLPRNRRLPYAALLATGM